MYAVGYTESWGASPHGCAGVIWKRRWMRVSLPRSASAPCSAISGSSARVTIRRSARSRSPAFSWSTISPVPASCASWGRWNRTTAVRCAIRPPIPRCCAAPPTGRARRCRRSRRGTMRQSLARPRPRASVRFRDHPARRRSCPGSGARPRLGPRVVAHPVGCRLPGMLHPCHTPVGEVHRFAGVERAWLPADPSRRPSVRCGEAERTPPQIVPRTARSVPRYLPSPRCEATPISAIGMNVANG